MLSDYDTASLKFMITGGDHQCLQVTFNNSHNIKVKPGSVIFSSENIKRSGKETYNGGMITAKCEWMVLTGNTQALSYIGLSSGIGKILVVNFDINEEMVFKYRKILAYTGTIYPRHYDVKHGVLGEEWCEMSDGEEQKKLASFLGGQIVLGTSQKNQKYTFMHTNNTVVEKELGHNEKMIVRSGNLIAFSKSVWLEKHSGVTGERGGHFLKITGPGLVYFEITNDPERPSGLANSERPRNQLRLFVFVFFVVFMLLLNSVNVSLLFV